MYRDCNAAVQILVLDPILFRQELEYCEFDLDKQLIKRETNPATLKFKVRRAESEITLISEKSIQKI